VNFWKFVLSLNFIELHLDFLPGAGDLHKVWCHLWTNQNEGFSTLCGSSETNKIGQSYSCLKKIAISQNCCEMWRLWRNVPICDESCDLLSSLKSCNFVQFYSFLMIRIALKSTRSDSFENGIILCAVPQHPEEKCDEMLRNLMICSEMWRFVSKCDGLVSHSSPQLAIRDNRLG